MVIAVFSENKIVSPDQPVMFNVLACFIVRDLDIIGPRFYKEHMKKPGSINSRVGKRKSNGIKHFLLTRGGREDDA